MEIYIDAAFHPTRKDSAIIAVIKKSNEPIILSQYIDHIDDNHLAEFKALEMTLTWLVSHVEPTQMIIIHCDSQIVVQSVNKRYVKDKRYQAVFKEILPLLELFDLLFIKWVPEKENRQADHLARQLLRKQENV